MVVREVAQCKAAACVALRKSLQFAAAREKWGSFMP